MKRNNDWAKKLLTFLEDEPEGTGLLRHELKASFEAAELGRWMTPQQISDAVDYHLHLLASANFVLVYESQDDYEDSEGNDDEFILTWAGHDYLEGK